MSEPSTAGYDDVRNPSWTLEEVTRLVQWMAAHGYAALDIAHAVARRQKPWKYASEQAAAGGRCCDGHHTRGCNDILCCAACPQRPALPVRACWKTTTPHAPHEWDSNHHLPGTAPARCSGRTERQVVDSMRDALEGVKRGRIW